MIMEIIIHQCFQLPISQPQNLLRIVGNPGDCPTQQRVLG